MNELFIKRMKELLKNDFDAFINSLNENEVKGFYLNPLKKDVLNHLNHQYIEKHPYVDGGYYFDYLHYPLGKSPYFMCGLYYIQEPSAMSVAACLDIKENDYNLNIPRYVDTFEEEEPIDLVAVSEKIASIDKEIAKIDDELAVYLRELGL